MILLFAGTSNARRVADELIRKGEKLVICTATPYGASLYPSHESILEKHDSPLDIRSMEEFVKARKPELIVDATHPFAERVSKNIWSVAKKLGIPVRIEKRAEESFDDVLYVDGFEEARTALEETGGNILLTIGSNHLDTFAKENLMPRMYVRVLPTVASLEKCSSLGFSPARTIAMQGPFSMEMNQAIYRQYDIKVMLSKDSGKEGGVEEKVLPALDTGIKVILIRRPKEERQ